MPWVSLHFHVVVSKVDNPSVLGHFWWGTSWRFRMESCSGSCHLTNEAAHPPCCGCPDPSASPKAWLVTQPQWPRADLLLWLCKHRTTCYKPPPLALLHRHPDHQQWIIQFSISTFTPPAHVWSLWSIFALKLQGFSYSRNVFLLEPLRWKFWRLEDQPVEVSYLLGLLTYSSLRKVGVLLVQSNC